MRRSRPLPVALAGLALLLAGSARAGEWAGCEMKTAYVYNFAKFVDWPSPDSDPRPLPFVIGVFGDDSLIHRMAGLLKDHTVRGRSVIVRRLISAEQGRACQVVVLPEAEGDRIGQCLAALEAWPVLTVGEGIQFAEAGGMIGFYVESERLRFAINPEAAQRGRLQISAKLLALATVVHDQSRPPSPGTPPAAQDRGGVEEERRP